MHNSLTVSRLVEQYKAQHVRGQSQHDDSVTGSSVSNMMRLVKVKGRMRTPRTFTVAYCIQTTS
jgi:hypothetical protein